MIRWPLSSGAAIPFIKNAAVAGTAAEIGLSVLCLGTLRPRLRLGLSLCLRLFGEHPFTILLYHIFKALRVVGNEILAVDHEYLGFELDRAAMLRNVLEHFDALTCRRQCVVDRACDH